MFLIIPLDAISPDIVVGETPTIKAANGGNPQMQPINDHGYSENYMWPGASEGVAGLRESDPMPLASAIMPTYGRPDLVNESVAMFLDQDYDKKELIIFNDCAGQRFHFEHPQVTVINQTSRFASLGEKRNACIEQANGEILAVWDDDDVYLPWRLSDAVSEMMRQQIPFYRPAEFWAYWGSGDLHDNQAIPGWVNHAFCCYTKKIWAAVDGYPPQSLGEDAVFFDRIHTLLNLPFMKSPIAKYKRSAILRGVSPYEHLSIGGGKQPLDLTPGVYEIQPKPVADNRLAHSKDILIARHVECVARLKETPEVTQHVLDRPALSVCVSLRNRSRIRHEGRDLELFPNCVAALVAAVKMLVNISHVPNRHSKLPTNAMIVELVIADFGSDDWPLAGWIERATTGLRLKHLCLKEDFSRGRGLNLAVTEASSDRLFLLDADMLVTPQLLQTGIDTADQQEAYFPVFRNMTESGELLHFEHSGFGNAFVWKQLFHAAGGLPEFQSWGGEDDVLFERLSKIASIRRDEVEGFHHQWHPEYCRHENYRHTPRQDFREFRSRQNALQAERTFSVSHDGWFGWLSLLANGKMHASTGDRGHYEWSEENTLRLNWDSWPVETLVPGDTDLQWKAEGYHFVIEEKFEGST